MKIEPCPTHTNFRKGSTKLIKCWRSFGQNKGKFSDSCISIGGESYPTSHFIIKPVWLDFKILKSGLYHQDPTPLWPRAGDHWETPMGTTFPPWLGVPNPTHCRHEAPALWFWHRTSLKRKGLEKLSIQSLTRVMIFVDTTPQKGSPKIHWACYTSSCFGKLDATNPHTAAGLRHLSAADRVVAGHGHLTKLPLKSRANAQEFGVAGPRVWLKLLKMASLSSSH